MFVCECLADLRVNCGSEEFTEKLVSGNKIPIQEVQVEENIKQNHFSFKNMCLLLTAVNDPKNKAKK
jgi:hypothetical protein